MLNYDEFKKKYAWSCKKYPDVTTFFSLFEKSCGAVEITKQQKHGKKWVDVEKTVEKFNGKYYLNTVESIPFFRNFGGERVSKTYTRYGLIPTQLVSTSPDKAERYIRVFKFN